MRKELKGEKVLGYSLYFKARGGFLEDYPGRGACDNNAVRGDAVVLKQSYVLVVTGPGSAF